MKITKQRLKEIIREELSSVKENSPYSGRKAYKAHGPGGAGLGMGSSNIPNDMRDEGLYEELEKWFKIALEKADVFQMKEIIEELKDILGVNI